MYLLTTFPYIINIVFLDAEAQLIMVYMAQNSVRYISNKDRKVKTSDIKEICFVPSKEVARELWTGSVKNEQQVPDYFQIMAKPMEQGRYVYEILF